MVASKAQCAATVSVFVTVLCIFYGRVHISNRTALHGYVHSYLELFVAVSYIKFILNPIAS